MFSSISWAFKVKTYKIIILLATLLAVPEKNTAEISPILHYTHLPTGRSKFYPVNLRTGNLKFVTK